MSNASVSLLDNDDVELWAYAPTPAGGYFDDSMIDMQPDESWNPALIQHYPVSDQPQSSLQGGLRLLDFAEWEKEKEYNEDPPSCIHYSIEWKVRVNKRQVATDTEQDLVFVPRDYWPLTLKPKLETFLDKNVRCSKVVKTQDTIVTFSTSKRFEKSLVKRFEGTDIDWSMIEQRLESWNELFRSGRTLMIDISFNYVTSEVDHGSAVSVKRKQPRGSTTQRMLTEQGDLLDAEEASTDRPSIWREVYRFFRCPGPPCSKGPHCWINRNGKVHHPLRTHHFQSLIEEVATKRLKIQTHEDISGYIQDQLKAEEHLRLKKQTRSKSQPLPVQVPNAALSESAAGTISGTAPRIAAGFKIAGDSDENVIQYTQWLQSAGEKSGA